MRDRPANTHTRYNETVAAMEVYTKGSRTQERLLWGVREGVKRASIIQSAFSRQTSGQGALCAGSRVKRQHVI